MLIEEVNYQEISPKFNASEVIKSNFLLYWDSSRKKAILSEIMKNDERVIHFIKILLFLFERKENQYKKEMYRKENDGVPNQVVAMKFLGNAAIFGNLRIYCQEHKINGKYHIVMSRVHVKQGEKNQAQERKIIGNIAKEKYIQDILEIELKKRPRRKI